MEEFTFAQSCVRFMRLGYYLSETRGEIAKYKLDWDSYAKNGETMPIDRFTNWMKRLGRHFKPGVIDLAARDGCRPIDVGQAESVDYQKWKRSLLRSFHPDKNKKKKQAAKYFRAAKLYLQDSRLDLGSTNPLSQFGAVHWAEEEVDGDLKEYLVGYPQIVQALNRDVGKVAALAKDVVERKAQERATEEQKKARGGVDKVKMQARKLIDLHRYDYEVAKAKMQAKMASMEDELRDLRRYKNKQRADKCRATRKQTEQLARLADDKAKVEAEKGELEIKIIALKSKRLAEVKRDAAVRELTAEIAELKTTCVSATKKRKLEDKSRAVDEFEQLLLQDDVFQRASKGKHFYRLLKAWYKHIKNSPLKPIGLSLSSGVSQRFVFQRTVGGKRITVCSATCKTTSLSDFYAIAKENIAQMKLKL